ncbi:MAG: hypothetical protein DSZ04_00015 [Sulfurimonas sp.]|nr:MAG: hypothetical protein DSZ04_00015 [Sulfurimonas sp.]
MLQKYSTMPWQCNATDDRNFNNRYIIVRPHPTDGIRCFTPTTEYIGPAVTSLVKDHRGS